MDTNPDPDHVPPIDPAFVAKLNELRNTKWYGDIVTRAAAKRVLGHLKPKPKPKPKPPFPPDLDLKPAIPVPAEYPDWVLDALAASDGDPDDPRIRVLPVRAEPDPNPVLKPNGNGGWYPVANAPGSAIAFSNGANGFSQSYPATWTGVTAGTPLTWPNGAGGHFSPGGTVALPFTGIDPANGGPAIGGNGQITLFTGEIPPRGQPYPFGHQHPHVHFRTVAAPPDPPGGATYSHSHFHKHGGRISDHEDYNLDQHTHPH